MKNPAQPHRDDRATALEHFNSSFRHRYHLPALTQELLVGLDGLDEAWDSIKAIRAEGVADASCAILARLSLAMMPRYAIGFLDGQSRVHVQSPPEGDEASYRSNPVILVNPAGGYDNWTATAAWVRASSNRSRREWLAGLASERRPDWESVDETLRRAGRAMILPPDEGFSASRAAEVAYIYQIEVATLRGWKSAYRGERAKRQPGRPKTAGRSPGS